LRFVCVAGNPRPPPSPTGTDSACLPDSAYLPSRVVCRLACVHGMAGLVLATSLPHFVLLGAGGAVADALVSGTDEALLYDSLKAAGAQKVRHRWDPHTQRRARTLAAGFLAPPSTSPPASNFCLPPACLCRHVVIYLFGPLALHDLVDRVTCSSTHNT